MLDLILGLHLVSMHAPDKDHNNQNLGAYVRTAEGWTAGGYRNSIGRNSFYAGRTFEYGPFGVTLAGITGYQKKGGLGFSRGGITPMLAPSVCYGPVRISYIPRIGERSSVAHLSLEFHP